MSRKRITDEELIGKEFYSTQDLKYKVVRALEKCNGYRYFEVEFEETGSRVRTRMDKLQKGQVRDPKNNINKKLRIDEQEFIGYKGINGRNEPFEVIEFVERNNELMYKVRFLDTGNEKVFAKSSITRGTIMDPIHVEGFIGYKGTNNQGEEFEVIGLGIVENEKRKYDVRFMTTRYVGRFAKPFIIKGEIRDPYYPTIHGVACLGLAKARKDNKPTKEFNLWNGIINRCYNKKNDRYKNYGAKGITVCDRWKCFEYFLEDLPKIQGYEYWNESPEKYNIDKDILQQDVPDNQKIYSLETCVFTSITQNSLEMLQRRYSNKPNMFSENIYDRYYVRVSGDPYGTYTNNIAAANIYNHVARYRGYPEEYLIHNIPYMDRLECCNYRLSYGKNKPMIYLLERQRNTKIGLDNTLVNVENYRPILMIKDQQKYNDF